MLSQTITKTDIGYGAPADSASDTVQEFTQYMSVGGIFIKSPDPWWKRQLSESVRTLPMSWQKNWEDKNDQCQ